MQDFEKLGVFYLGKGYDLAARKRRDDLLLYDSKDLVTHGVCVGMTGSGKTGLCISLLEEAAIDGIPCIAIDPKGDLSNLLLTFPELRPQDFQPWINEDDARRKGVAPQDFAAQQAETWKRGLAEWGQDGARIQRLRDAAEFAVYTPGSNAGLPVSILKSFAAPSSEILDEPELLRERISTTATSLLGLLGIEADPIQSREHILISTILNSAWKAGKDVDLGCLIQQIQAPPVQRIGVMDLESFFPAKERFALSMRLNNLLAAPGFEAWLEGEALDIDKILFTPGGKPRVAIFSIAHLGDAERMFFVSLLLNQILGWMRTQSGTTSLRALLYMDEIFGYFPPVANPPSKQPLLTLLKQARAFGLGVVLATQNPVDLDYKGLANAGTWFIGRLQTERDKARVLEGLEGAAATASQPFNRAAMEQALASLSSRVFLMNNVHDDAPTIFETRWAMSYLRGPLARNQIKQLRTAAVPAAERPVAGETPAVRTAAVPAAPRPVLPPQIAQGFVPLRSMQPAGATLVYRPALFGCAKIYFTDSKAQLNASQDVCALVPLDDRNRAPANAPDWAAAKNIDLAAGDLEQNPEDGASFGALPAAASQAKSYDEWKKAFGETLFRTQKLDLFRSNALGEMSKPGESERDFRIRLQQRAREERDQIAEKLRQKYAPKLLGFEERIRRAKQAVEREQAQATQSHWQTAISFGATVLGAFLGRKAVSASTIGRAGTAARGVGRSMKESQDVARASETVEAVERQRAEIEAEFKAETDALAARLDPATEQLETLALRPKKTDIAVQALTLAWLPHWQDGSGAITSAWE